MPVTFTGTSLPQEQLEEIQREIYADWGTFRDIDVDIQEGFKSGGEAYEVKTSVIMGAYSSAAVSAGSDTLIAYRSPVTLTKIQFQGTVDYNTLLNTRFEKSMKRGAFNLVSQEFDNAVLQEISPSIAQTMESVTWDGAIAATKTAIAALTPGASQGSISAGAQTLVAAMPTNLVDSFPTVILYNASQAKATPGAGLGDYIKVLSISAITSSNIAAQYALWYATLDPKVIASPDGPPIAFAPLAHKQLMKIANNSVGAASNQNFLFEGSGKTEKCYYNGIEIKFKPLIGFIIVTNPKYLKILMDLKGDMSELETGKMANGAQQYYYKNVQSFACWVTNQRYIVLYGG